MFLGMGTRRVGIRDIAEAAGVSATTVSHGLNGKGRLPQETRERIRRIAEELGYRPNISARNLKRGRTGLLGLASSRHMPFALSDFAYFAQLMAGAATASMDRGYPLVLAPPNRAIGETGGIEVDGAIFVDPVRDDPLVDELRGLGIPLVTTGRVLGSEHADAWVDNDHRAATDAILDHLHRRGARRIALLTTPTEISYRADLDEAYGAWCAAHDMRPRIAYARADLTESAGFNAATELLSAPDPPDAIFASYDRLAYGALLAARAGGINVPDELLLAMTATASGTAQPGGPAITAVDLHPEHIGRAAAGLLVDLLEERPVAETNILVPTRIISRASTRRRATHAA
jgi:DNA-binding LacI/PurR family transcriptional regulator